jgi:regulator of nonsense transcripts 1
MEGAFTHVGNHLISDSAAAINAGNDLPNLDASDSLLFGDQPDRNGHRRPGPNDTRAELPAEDDDESLSSAAADGITGLKLDNGEVDPGEVEQDLPAHACAFVSPRDC